MYDIKKLLVALELTEEDPDVVRYTFEAVKTLGTVKAIYFLHVVPKGKLLASVEGADGKYDTIQDAKTKQLRDLVDSAPNKPHGVELNCYVSEGDVVDEILRNGHDLDVDLLVVGRKATDISKARIPRLIVRQALRSVMVVPQHVKLNFSKCLIPLDYTDYSKYALERAVSISHKTRTEIVCLNTYHLPLGHYSSGRRVEEFASIMAAHAQKRYNIFLKKVHTTTSSIHPVFEFDREKSLAKAAHRTALAHHADIILMGSRGRTFLASLLLKSVAEELIELNTSIPTLIIKNKLRNLSFWEALVLK